ncbi:MAG: InlB B-repeat-containing protein, partial [Bacilli bacterium]|nr:InlB B-repeat-containing protein [Bacilli bacterium]
MQAGCKLTIGIKTITPSSADNPDTEEIELRRDFYNFGIATENDLTKVSNTVHTWMGTDKVSLYNVKYEYTGEIPNNAPQLPLSSNYSASSSVGVALIPILEGYSFTGWTSDEVNVINNRFIMPEKDVTFKGSFEKLDMYKVSYEIDGVIPESYVIPLEKNHYPNSFVKLDSLKKGDVFNGYRFMGWESNDVIINDDQTFIMPEKNVVIKGHFEPVTYKVEYRFYDFVLPPNSESLLPETKEYRPGSQVTLDYPEETIGYKFLGWYKESNFIMPNSDVIVYGEWQIQNGVFTPSIKKEIVNEQDYYKTGDIVYYIVTITNNEDYPIKDVIIEEKNKNAEFYQNELFCLMGLSSACKPDYTVKTANLVEISQINPHSSIEILSKYIVRD